MPLNKIIAFLLFALLAVYLAFLNPHDTDFYLTQSLPLRVPLVVLVLGAVLLGALIASLFNWVGEVRRSFRRIRAALKIKSRDRLRRRMEVLYEKGENALATGRRDKAMDYFEKILEAFPNHIGALNNAGNLLRENGDLERATKLHTQASALSPDNVRILYNLAEDHLAAGNQILEMRVLEKIQKIDRNSTQPLVKMRQAYVAMKDWASAAEVQDKIVSKIHKREDRRKEQIRLSEFLYKNGLRFFKNGNVESAIREFKRSIRENDRCLPAYISQGDALIMEENRKAALKVWKSGYQKTRSPICLQRIQQAQQESDNLKEMEKLYGEAIRSANNSERETLQMMLGALYLKKGKVDEAIDTLEGIQPGNKVIYSLLLAQAYQEKKDSRLSEKFLHERLDETCDSVLAFTCVRCGSSHKSWEGMCPACGAWDSITCDAFHLPDFRSSPTAEKPHPAI